jgi:hypothetical protein
MQVFSPPNDAANGKRIQKSGTVTLDRPTPTLSIIDWGSARVKWRVAFSRSLAKMRPEMMERRPLLELDRRLDEDTLL